ncbi:MAG TPA: hypothetical protein VMV10_03515 [Pirellulales bacterium]|nr:hypothetical protein [Pirellulales bacterium]
MRLIEGGWMLAAALAAAALGCESMNPRTVQIDAASGRYHSAQLTYELDTGRLSQPVQTARIQAQQVSYQQLPSTPLPDRSLARLSVKYPHPQGKADFALAEVVIVSDHPKVKSATSAGKSAFERFASSFAEAMNDILPGMTYGDGVREAWALDIPKEQLDDLVGHLANSGYFQYGPAPTPGVDVFTQLNGRTISKHWRQVPELDAFIERVRHEGSLVSYNRPQTNESAPADAAGGRNDSVVAYQQQLQRQQAQAGPPPQPYPIGNVPPPRQFGPPPQQGPDPRLAGPGPVQNGWRPNMPVAGPYGNPPQPYGNAAPPQNFGPRPPVGGANPYQNPAVGPAYPQASQPGRPNVDNPPSYWR